jgi:hypothetical protein
VPSGSGNGGISSLGVARGADNLLESKVQTVIHCSFSEFKKIATHLNLPTIYRLVIGNFSYTLKMRQAPQ